MSDKKNLLKTVQELGFTLIDNGLYLNAYNSKESLEYGKKILEMYKNAVDEYTENYGPLTSKDSYTFDKWYWTETPWPWELEANC